jgi:ferric-dicitrate binding protein FerR (iron transport regulator)
LSAPDDHRLEELFLRYWDNALSDSQASEFEQLLRSDPESRDRFRFLSLQAVTAADLTAVGRVPELARIPATRTPRHLSRRNVLRFLGGGLAAGLAAGVVGRQFWDDSRPVRMTGVRGAVRLMTEDGEAAARDGGVIPRGATVSTYGFDSSVLLTCPDGTGVSLAGDSSLTVEGDRRLVLKRGNATAEVRPPSGDHGPLVLATAVASMTSQTGASLAIGHVLTATEVGVREGRITVSGPSGEPMGVVQEGELLTVRDDGDRKKQPLSPTPAHFALDLTRPLPDGWHIGNRVDTPAGPVLRPAVYNDPYHKYTPMYQVRSDKQWLRGFFQLTPESVVQVRYRVAKPGPQSQVVICVRSTQLPNSATGVLEYNGAFSRARPGEWQTLSVRAREMLDNKHTPAFDAPWVGFLYIVNTYEEDLGLEIADFRVIGPGRPTVGA